MKKITEDEMENVNIEFRKIDDINNNSDIYLSYIFTLDDYELDYLIRILQTDEEFDKYNRYNIILLGSYGLI